MLRNYEYRAPILGKIRLGVKKLSESGTEYPTTVEYFVLNSLEPDLRAAVEAVYGPEPKELDIMFPMDDIAQVIPTWLKLYSGARKNAKGETIGGKLRCYGDGPDREGNPGKAVWLEKKDPVTGIAPQRDCLGPRCPDWKDRNGRTQCAQTMHVYAMLPRVSHYGVFEIVTHSWHSISSFHNQLNWIKSFNNGAIRGLVLKIAREEVVTTFTDPSGNQKTGKQFIMRLLPNENGVKEFGEEIALKLQSTFGNSNILLPSAEELVERPSGSAYALESPTEEEVEAEVMDKVATAEELLTDPEVKEAFVALEKKLGKTFSDKTRLISIRKLEGAENLKAAVINSIMESLKE